MKEMKERCVDNTSSSIKKQKTKQTLQIGHVFSYTKLKHHTAWVFDILSVLKYMVSNIKYSLLMNSKRQIMYLLRPY